MKNFWCTLFIIVGSLFSLNSYGYDKVSLVTFEFNGENVEIKYSAYLEKHQELRIVGVRATINGESLNLKHITGDIGKIKSAGRKTIIWDCFAELGNEPIDGNISFDVLYETRNLSSYGVSDWNIFAEVNYTPSAPFVFGIGFGKRLGWYFRYGVNTKPSRTTMSTGAYFRIINWLSVYAGYNYLYCNQAGSIHGYEVGGTFYFLKSRWLGVNAGYIGSFAGQSEFQIGLTFCWNIH